MKKGTRSLLVVGAACVLGAGALGIVLSIQTDSSTVPRSLQLELRSVKQYIETAVSGAEDPGACDTTSIFLEARAELPLTHIDPDRVYVNPDPLRFFTSDRTPLVVYRPLRSRDVYVCFSFGNVDSIYADQVPTWATAGRIEGRQ